MTLIVGLGHESQHGKDTAARAIVSAYESEYDIRSYAFATELKLEVFDVLLNPAHRFWWFMGELTNGKVFYRDILIPKPMSHHEALYYSDYTNQEKLLWIEQHKPALRYILQVYGTEYARAKDSFYWVKKVEQRLAKESPAIAIITDMRFFSEAYFVKANKGYTVRIVREGFVNEAAAAHVSEQELAGYEYDYVITTPEGDVKGLEADAVEVMGQIISLITPPALTTEDFTEEAFGV